MNKNLVFIIVIIVLITVAFSTSIFTVDETEQAIVTQLGKFVREVKEPGLHFKFPLIQKEHKFEARVMEYDAAAAKIITDDKKNLVIDDGYVSGEDYGKLRTLLLKYNEGQVVFTRNEGK